MIREDYVPYIGEWAELRKNYLLEEKPEDFQELVESKLLIEYFKCILAHFLLVNSKKEIGGLYYGIY